MRFQFGIPNTVASGQDTRASHHLYNGPFFLILVSFFSWDKSAGRIKDWTSLIGKGIGHTCTIQYAIRRDAKCWARMVMTFFSMLLYKTFLSCELPRLPISVVVYTVFAPFLHLPATPAVR